jgi:hypothetical protein
MNSKQITSLLLFVSISLAACADAPKEVSSTQTASSPQSAAAEASATTPSGIAVGHDTAASMGGPAASGQSGEAAAGSVRWSAPARWESKPASGMRTATYLIPAAKGDPEGAECAVFRNIAGGVDANIKRWIGQFEQPDGSSSDAKAKQKKENISGFDITTVDLTGTFKGGGPMMGMPGQSSGPKTGYRLLGAIVETQEGEVFFKMTGPEKTMAAAQGEFQTLLKSLKK